MILYDVTIDELNHCFIIKGNFNPSAIPIKIPDEQPDKQSFIDYFLYKADIDNAFSYLQCISADKNFCINEALFLAGLSSSMKCFKESKARKGIRKIDRNKFITAYPNSSGDLEFFESMRDKHFIHDENEMTQPTAFLLLNPIGSPEKFGGPPSVIYNSVKLDYYTESQRLQQFLCSVRNYIIGEIDCLGDEIAKSFKDVQYEKLVQYGPADIKLASIQNINKTR
jgi:hypothetical protein